MRQFVALSLFLLSAFLARPADAGHVRGLLGKVRGVVGRVVHKATHPLEGIRERRASRVEAAPEVTYPAPAVAPKVTPKKLP